ncbi:hypothetical protein BC833DRAFT_576668 [Globomyces pollinis-pini]|nr:hypothetical protein BC833DRAFT_576668 [Globomyces pollinis-pini]
MAPSVDSCANPLFARWIQDWIDDEERKSSSTHFRDTLKRALKALIIYPLNLKSGKDAMIVKYIGQKIADRLDKRLLEHHRDNFPSNLTNPTPDVLNQHLDPPVVPSVASFSTTKTKTKAKPYIPASRSGAYAILIALFRYGSATHFLTKDDIIAKSQEFCDASFTVPQRGTITAWKSMDSLKKKDLVISMGKPSRYCLSDEGKALAKKLSDHELAIVGQIPAPTNGSNSHSNCSTFSMNSQGNSQNGNEHTDISSFSTKPHHLPPSSSNNTKSLPDINVKARKYTDNKTLMETLIPDARKRARYISEQAEYNTTLSSPDENTHLADKFSTSNSLNSGGVIPPKSPKFRFADDQKVDNSTNMNGNADQNPQQQLCFRSSSFETGKSEYESRNQEKIWYDYLRSSPPTPRMIPANSYEILVVLDSREVRKRDDRDYFQKRLEEQGVSVLTKVLELGDIVWVARPKSSNSLDDLIMLDYIAERKRNDDLASSIKDGRFKEQKHRLKQCGIENLIYIVEEFNQSYFSPEAMVTSLTQTQIVDDLFLKQTLNVDDTISYLVTLTNAIKRSYQNKPLYVLDSSIIYQETHQTIRKRLFEIHGHSYHMQLSTFNSLSHKTKSFTVRDVWIRQLMTIRGVSPEKALLIISVYPTLYSLYEALSQCRNQEQQIKCLVDIGDQGRKVIGTALSKKIVNFFTS